MTLQNVVAVSAVIVLITVPCAHGQLRTVVFSEQSLPGLDGQVPEDITSWRINELGQVAVLADEPNNPDGVGGIWRFDPNGTTVPIAVAGQPEPGGDGNLFNNRFSRLSMNDHGQVAFSASNIGTSNTAIRFTSADGEVNGQDGTFGTPLNVFLDNSGGMSAQVNNSSIAWFVPGGSQASSGFSVRSESFDHNGHAAFIDLPSVQTGQRILKRTQFGGNEQVIAREAILGRGGVSFKSLGGDTSINSQGTLAFSATFTESGGPVRSGLWIGGAGYDIPELVLRDGDPVPGVPGGEFGSIGTGTTGDVQFFDSNELLYKGRFWTPGASVAKDGLFASEATTGELKTIILEDSLLPGRGDSNINGIGEFYGGESGNIVCEVFLSSEDDSALSAALLGYNSRTDMVDVLFETGDLLEVAPGDFREIASLMLSDGDSERVDVKNSVLNSDNRFAFYASFTDGTQGVFVATVPAPASTCVICLAALTATRRRR